MKDTRYLFIVNPVAGHGKSRNILPLINDFLETWGPKHEIKCTREQGEAKEIAENALGDGYTHVIAVGGDGTSSEVANGLFGTPIIFGSIPAGSGNDFPKSSSIPLDTKQALQTIIEGYVRLVDVGKLGDKYFINGLGIGLDGAVSHRFKKLKKMRGQLGYLLGAFQEALTFKGVSMGIKIDGWEYEGPVLLTGASNGVYQGGKFKLAPQARVDDGMLDFHIIKDMSSLSRLIKIPKVLQGTHSNIPEVDIKQSSRMELTLKDRVPAHMDGEPFYLEPGKHIIEIRPKALRVMSSTDGSVS